MKKITFKEKMKLVLTIFTLIFSSFLFGQNGIIGSGFTNGWGTGDIVSFDASAGSSRIKVLNPRGTGNQFFRLVRNWSGDLNQFGPFGCVDLDWTNPGVIYGASTCNTSGAFFINCTNTTDNYVFKTPNGNTSTDLLYFRIQGAVRLVSSVAQSPAAASVAPNMPVTVTATLDGALSTGQAVYLRSSTNNFATSTVTQMTGSGTTYSAQISGASASTVVRYYVFTSGIINVASNGSNADLYTINLNNNAGTNYSYTVAAATNVVTVTSSGGTGSALYTTLKGAFDAINAGTHTGAIIVSINGNTTEGTTPATLNSSGAGSASYTSVLIRPTADAVSVSGNPATGFGVIQLKGADNVTIDGDNPNSAGTNRNLSINNTAAASVIANSCIRIATATNVLSADNIIIRNCNLNGNVTSGNSSSITLSTSSSNSSFGIYCGGNGGSTATDAPTAITSVTTNTAPSGTTINNLLIDNNAINQCARAIVFNGNASSVSSGVTISNNLIGATATLTGNAPFTTPASTVYTKGIWINGTNAITISGNTLQNIMSYVATPILAIELVGAIGSGTISISENIINGVAQNSSSSTSKFGGILVSSAGGPFSVTNNTISNINGFNTTLTSGSAGGVGIDVATAATSAMISRNSITKVYNRGNGYAARGIVLNGGNNVTVQNNYISDVLNIGSTSFSLTYGAFGILANGGIGHKIYHNSVNLFGTNTGTGSNLTACFGILATSQTGIDVRNNIFSNTMTSSAASNANVSIYLPSGGTNAMNLTLNNNAYYTGTTAGVNGICHAGTTYTSPNTATAGLWTAANFNSSAITPSSNLRSYTIVLSAAGTNDNASFAATTAAPFTSNTNLKINTSASGVSALFATGASGTGVTTDIENEARPTNPCIGADEFILTPTVVLANNGTQVAASNVSPGTTNLVLHQSQLTVTTSAASLTGMSCTTAGTYISTDVTNLKVWYSTSATFSAGTSTLLSTLTNPGTAGAKTFASFSTQSVPVGTGYIYITADIAGGATNNNTINLSALATTNFTFASANFSGNTSAGGSQTFVSSSVEIADNGTQITAANISAGTTNLVLHKSQLTVSNATSSLTGITCTTAGTYASADVTNLKVWYSTNSTFNSGTSTLLSTLTTPGGAGLKTFSSFSSQAVPVGTAYIYITADIASAATNGNTINVNALTTTDYTFASGSKTGSTTAGGTQTILVPTVVLADNGTQVGASFVDNGTTNVLLHQSQLAVTNTTASLTGLTCTTNGTYVSASITNLKLWYSTNSTFDVGSATLLSTLTTPGTAGAKTFPSFSQSIASGTTGYIYITADISAAATNANTINVSALTTSNFTFTTSSFSGSTTVGGVKTIRNYCSPPSTTLHSTINNYVSNVTITGTSLNSSNGTSASGYTLVASTPSNNTATLSQGLSYPVALTLVTASTCPSNGFQYSVWVDFNQNGTFETTEYFNFNGTCSGTAGGTLNGTITIPLTATLGSTRMRLRARGAIFTNSEACKSFGSGETEDYTITIAIPPSCLPPSVSATTVIASTTATINWTASSSSPTDGYEWEVRSSGNGGTGATGLATSGTVAAGVLTANVTGLTGNTSYTVWVRANCGSGGFSQWVSGGSFTTNQIPATLPYTDNLNTNNFTLINGVQTNKWAYGSAAGNPANAIYISSDNGVTNNYNNGSTSVVQAYREIIIPNGTTNANLSFDWRGTGETCCDYLRVWLVPVSFTPTAGTQITSGSGRIQIGGNYNAQATWTTYNNTSVNLSSFAGTTMRLVFEWRNDGSAGSNPPSAIDNVNLYIPDPITITPSSSTTFCSGSSLNLTASSTANYTYTWSPSTGLNTTSGATVTANPTTTTTYTVTGNNGAGMIGTQTITITVNPSPTEITIQSTINGTDACNQNYVELSVTGNNAVAVFEEGFETNPVTKFNLQASGSGEFYDEPYFTEGSSAISLVGAGDIDFSNGNTRITLANSIDLSQYASATLTFDHICASEATYDFGYVQYSLDGGTSWTSFPTTAYSGTGTLKNGVVSFDKSSYSDWNAQFTSDTSTPGTAPATALFKSESINLNAFMNNTNFRIRFRLSYNDSNDYYGWIIDNVKINIVPKVTWSPITNLFTDTALTTAYTTGTNAATVYALPNGVQNYTATATIGSCTKTDTETVTNYTKRYVGTNGGSWDVINSWLPTGIPTIDNCVKIPTGKSVIVSGSTAIANTLTIESNTATITVNSDGILKLNNTLTNLGTGSNAIFENNSSLIQINNVTNTGNITYERTSPQTVLNTDYVYWASPVSGQNVPSTGLNYFWNNAAGTSGNWVNASGQALTAGKGVIMRGIASRNFTGVPFNGEITVAVHRRNIADYNDNWNLIGNPYPSAISAEEFLRDLDNTAIEGSIAIWTHGSEISNSITTQPFYGNFTYNYNPNDYIIYNLTGPQSGIETYQGFIPAGQGFFVKYDNDDNASPTAASSTIKFKNSMRSDASGNAYNNTQFYRNSGNVSQNIEKSRIWIDIINGSNAFNRTLVGYIENATDGKDRLYDSTTSVTSTSTSIYSLIGNDKMCIQAKGLPFNNSDIIPLGYNASQAGNYTIAIHALDGLFVNQNVYLYDAQLNITHDIKVTPYTFTATQGENNSRFQLIFNNETLSNPDFDSENAVFLINKDNLKVVSAIENIEEIKVFDLLGRTLYINNHIDNKEFEIPVSQEKVALIVKIKLANGIYVERKTMY